MQSSKASRDRAGTNQLLLLRLFIVTYCLTESAVLFWFPFCPDEFSYPWFHVVVRCLHSVHASVILVRTTSTSIFLSMRSFRSPNPEIWF